MVFRSHSVTSVVIWEMYEIYAIILLLLCMERVWEDKKSLWNNSQPSISQETPINAPFLFSLACPGGWAGPQTFNGETSCYLYVQEGLAQADARANCATEAGGDLVSIESAAENTFVNGELILYTLSLLLINYPIGIYF